MKNSQVGIRTRGLRGPMVLGLVILTALALGCQGNSSENSTQTLGLTSSGVTGDDFPGPAPPSFDELANRVQFSTNQLQPMKDALEGWRQAAQSLAEERRANQKKETCPNPESGDVTPHREPPMFPFLETSAGILTPDQFVQLVSFLAEYRDEHRQAGMKNRVPRGGESEGPRPGNGPFRDRLVDVLADKLNLTAEQQELIRKAHEEIRTEIDALHSEYGGRGRDNPDIRKRIRELRESMQNRLQAILTPAQYAQLQNLQKERQSRMAERRDERVGQRIDRLAEFLGNVLSLDQPEKQRVREILSNAENQLVGLRESMRDSSVVAGDLHDEFEKIGTDTHTAIRALLDADQAKKYDALKSLLPPGGGPGGGLGPLHGRPGRE